MRVYALLGVFIEVSSQQHGGMQQILRSRRREGIDDLWKCLPKAMGKPDSLGQTYRRESERALRFPFISLGQPEI